MSYINFQPHVGPDYWQSKPKIFVLGHSHYASDCDGSPEQISEWNNDLELTQKVIKDYYWMRCFRNVAAVLTDNDYGESNDYIWKRLAFGNFYQKVVGIGPRDKRFIND